MKQSGEVEKEHVHIVIELIEYIPNAVLRKTIIKKTTGNVTATSFDTGEELTETRVPYDCYIQIIDGTANLTIGGQSYTLRLGEGIVIPANASHCFKAKAKFKMISTCIHPVESLSADDN